MKEALPKQKDIETSISAVDFGSNIMPSANGSMLGHGTITSPNYVNKGSGWKLGSDGTIESLTSTKLSGVLTTTNFRKIIIEPNTTVEIWVSDGTSPNTALTAPKGSICLYCSATGQIAYNTDGSTAWTLL